MGCAQLHVSSATEAEPPSESEGQQCGVGNLHCTSSVFGSLWPIPRQPTSLPCAYATPKHCHLHMITPPQHCHVHMITPSQHFVREFRLTGLMASLCSAQKYPAAAASCAVPQSARPCVMSPCFRRPPAGVDHPWYRLGQPPAGALPESTGAVRRSRGRLSGALGRGSRGLGLSGSAILLMAPSAPGCQDFERDVRLALYKVPRLMGASVDP